MLSNKKCKISIFLFVFSDGRYIWLAKGNLLEVIGTKTGQRSAAWCFGVSIGEHETLITSVCEYEFENSLKLIVATNTSESNASLLSLFDISTSTIIKVIETPYKVGTVFENY